MRTVLVVTDRDRFVIEIGVGTQTPSIRPFARDAAYVGVDVDATLLTRRTAPVVAADARRLPFADHSVHYVVACNVFGDVGLGFGFEEVVGLDPQSYAEHLRRLIAQGAVGELEALRARVRAMTGAVHATKLGILGEAARVLRRGGELIAVETLTPQFAQEWISQLGAGRAKESTLTAEGVEYRCRAVPTHNRRRRYCTPAELANRSLKVWILTPSPEC
jgi:hypothetical protein